MCVYRSDCPGCCNQLRQASEPSVLTHTESIVSKVQIPLCKLWNTGGTWASDLLLTTQDRPHKHKQRTRQSTHAPGRDKTNTQREREYFCYSAFLSQRNSPSSFSIFISTSLTWSSQFLSVRNLRGRPGHTLLGLWTPEFFLTDQKVVAETPFLSPGPLQRRAVMSWGSAGEGQVSAAMWGEFFLFFLTFHESSPRKRKFVPRLFVYSMYTFSSPDGLWSSGLYFSSSCLASFFLFFCLCSEGTCRWVEREDFGGFVHVHA